MITGLYAMKDVILEYESSTPNIIAHVKCVIFFKLCYMYILPCPNSVWAYVPIILKFLASGTHFLLCSGRHCFISVGTNIPECRPKGLNSYGAADLQCIKNMIYFPYSQTCIKRPLLGPRKNGLIRQVTS